MTDRERDALTIEEMKYDSAGLIPAVIQQHDSGEILMVAYMNAESLAKTVETRKTWFWSRSRQKYWMKGESSGSTQDVIEIRYDCDADCLLVLVDQNGSGACHTGERTCFYRTLLAAPVESAPGIGEVLEKLFALLEQRKRDLPEDSYTTKLLTGKQDKLLKKIAEESGEVIIAACEGDRDQVRYESADLIYHLLVVLVRQGIGLDELAAELASRRR
ncbi:MAG: bifunctional phosphoribosyl-AMP cyclohydrolase/phosphoribosyl-ATP diphosphatase HisIE [Coriobacteriia bacterium]|nr:bifunctional phosphoribosyl-AMP cyclohydrolase/phosphoribosyl-ATP diphosphatase HisIE [Coriobacteriia bacterium]